MTPAQRGNMRSWLLFLTALIAFSTRFSQVKAAACAEICYTTELTGFGPGGAAGRSCSGSGATRAGSGGCSCGQCYEEANGAIMGYALNSDGTCTYGIDCGDCTRSPDTSSSTNTTPPSTTTSPTTTTTSPSTTDTPDSTITTTDVTTATSPPNTDQSNTSITPSTSDTSGSNDNKNAGDTDGDSAASEDVLKTWQIALIICCGVLVFTVAVVSVLSCYCKARNRLNENEDDQADVSYYQQQYPRQRSDVVGSSAVPSSTLFSQSAASIRSRAQSGNLANDMKSMYASSANSGSSDRLGMGLAPVHMRNGSGDMGGMAGNAGVSGNYPTDPRSTLGNSSRGHRNSLALEL